MKTREYEKCGASIEKNALQCAYCGTWYEGGKKGAPAKSSPGKRLSMFKLPSGEGEFGVSNSRFFVMGALTTAILYVLGWLFEDRQYWLDEKALWIWVGAIPIGLFCIAFLWRANHKVVMIGFAVSLVVFLAHISVIWIMRGSLWDDHVGIASMIAGASLAGWLLGRLGHGMVRWRNINVK